MEIIGKIVEKTKIDTVTKPDGFVWKKQTFIVENDNYFNRPICFTIFDDKIDESTIAIRQKIKIDFEIEALSLKQNV